MSDILPPYMMGAIAVRSLYTNKEMTDDVETVSADTIANVMLYCQHRGGDPMNAIERAIAYYDQEVQEAP
jgi:hypothetical protein